MNFIDLVHKRQSVRKYSPRPVEYDKIQRCLQAAILAPSASNSQPWTFVVADRKEIKDKVARLTFDHLVKFNRFVPEAPVIVVIVLEKPRLVTQVGGFVKRREFPLIDIGIAAEHFCLQAVEEGLGTCMLGWFQEKPIKRLLKIPPQKRIGLIISAGYPPDDYSLREKIRKPFSEVVKYNSYL
jgi:nitroreductase